MNAEYFNTSYLGYKIGQFEVVKITKSLFSGAAIWECKCNSCGNSTISIASLAIKGVNLSCSCGATVATKNETQESNSSIIISKYDRTRLGKIRSLIVNRCYNENNKSYHKYGLVGIKVCKEWTKSLNDFTEWALKNGYKAWLELKRYNINGGFNQENCYWGIKNAKNEQTIIDTVYKKEDVDNICNKYNLNKNKIEADILSNVSLIAELQGLLGKDALEKNKSNTAIIKKLAKKMRVVQSNIEELHNIATIYSYTNNNDDSDIDIEYIKRKIELAIAYIGDAIDKIYK